MNIGFIFMLVVLLALLSAFLYEGSPTLSRIFILSFVLIIIWASISSTLENKKQIFLTKIPVYFQSNIAFSVHNSNLINCSKEFKTQLKQGDSLYVFQEEESNKFGIYFSGGRILYKLNNNEKLVHSIE